MKLISWNVNGVRACLNKGFGAFLHKSGADVVCLQEAKALPEQVTWDLGEYQDFWNPAEKKGYSGTVILTKTKPIEVMKGMGVAALDNEGRVLTAEYETFFLVNVYTPNAKRDLSRLAWKQQVWSPAFQSFLQDLEQRKPVVVCGDLNVAHKEIDLANPKTNRRNAGFTDEERADMSRLIDEAGFIDTFREFNQEGDQYSWWSYRPGIRERNIGWRLDYFLASQSLKPLLQNAQIHQEVLGSDHCPVSLDLGC